LQLSVRVPYLSYEEIGKISREFLSNHGYDRQIPIDVEALLEFVLDVAIIPTPGFQQNHSVEGSLSLDMRTIFVDEYVYRAVENRFRFTLAHELGHILLHRSIFKDMKVDSVLEWKRAYKTIDEGVYSTLEKQAYDFAGLILVPSEDLQLRFMRMVSENKANFAQAKSKGISIEKTLDFFKANAIYRLARMFKVSPDVLERRIDKDDLMRGLKEKL
jgi:Zn-dependent peptidase ImmA (M78 family)